MGTGAVGVVRGFAWVGAGAGVVVVGGEVVLGAVVGGWTAGSGFSPHPAVATAAAAAAASASGRSRRHPVLREAAVGGRAVRRGPFGVRMTRFTLITPGTVTNRVLTAPARRSF